MSAIFPNKVSLLFTCLLFTSIGRSQELPEVSYISNDQGLSNNFVSNIYQDHLGIMWFGTFDGLNRYDGYTFKVFRPTFNNSGSIISNWISCIAEDGRQNLWVGTRSGISIFDPVTSSFHSVYYQNARQNKLQLLQSNIDNIKTDDQGNLFVASISQGLLFCKAGCSQPVQVPLSGFSIKSDTEDYHASGVAFDYQQRAWVLVKGAGLCLYDYKDNSLTVVNSEVKNGTCLLADKNNNLWLGSDNGLYKYNYASNVMTTVLPQTKRIMQLAIDRKNDLWIASDGDGVLKANINTGQVAPFPANNSRDLFKSSAVYSIYHDKQHRTWIGTLRGGITIIDPAKNRYPSLVHNPLNNNSLINNFTLSCCEDTSRNLWIGTDGGGISYWNRREKRFTNYIHQGGDTHSLSSNFVTNILQDPDKKMWMGTWGGGINRFNPAKKNFDHFPCLNDSTGREDVNIWALYADRHRNIWAGSCLEGGLYRMGKTGRRFELFDATLINIVSLFEDAEGQLWGGDLSSLIKIDTLQKKHLRYPLGFAVRAIYEDKKGRFWICTEGSGLLLFDKSTGRFQRFTEEQGLADNAVLKILEDSHHRLWLSTFGGISIFDPETRIFTSIAQSDGLLSNQLSYNATIALQSGEFVFGSIKGLNIFYPNISRESPVKRELLLTGLTINNIPVELDTTYITSRTRDRVQTIRLPYDKAVLSFEFVAPEYTSPDKMNYAFYLDGWDKDWNHSGKNRNANYSHLLEGSYVFKVRTSDPNGAWGPPASLLTIIVLPPWYRTWWAYTLYVTTFLMAIYTYNRYRSKQLQLAYEVDLAKMETEKEKELNEKKLSFFTNVSHEFRTPLTLIINPVQELLNRQEGPVDQPELNIVYRNAKRLLSLVDQLLLFRKAEADGSRLNVTKVNIYELCTEVFSYFDQQAKQKKIRYTFIHENTDLYLYADWEKLEIVLFNLISNAFKFTPDNGIVTFALAESENEIKIKVTDSGCGISGDAGDRIFERFYQKKDNQAPSHTGFGIGLYLAKEFVEAHKGKIAYISEPNTGTEFTIILQKGTLHLKEYISEETQPRIPAIMHELAEEMLLVPTRDPNNMKDPGEKEIITAKKSILIVDDDGELRHYLTKILQENFVVYEAAGGESGLQLAVQHMPDIIISDISMPGISGIDLCSKIKEDPATHHIPVILLTGSSSQDIQLKGIECGAEDYITKPFDKELLLASVNSILKNRNMLNQYFFDTVTLKKNTTKISAEYKDFLQRCIVIVENNIDRDEFCISRLAEEVGISHSGLYKKIKSMSGLSSNAFIRFIRLRQAAILLLSSDTNINEVAFQVGMTDVKYFREQFKKLFGVNPSEYIKRYKTKFNKDFSVIIK